jgi:hypothetical protein
MVAVAPNRSAPAEHSIHGASQSNGDTDQSSRQGDLVICLYEQMKVVALHGKMENSKPRPDRVPQCRPQFVKDMLFA